ncbi:Rieske (2Fe-2S) protein [Phytohabitans houttuyneae]|uniref:Rieske domain-containing protein n=1 Tax=Phytohabitans houttuyneae TaxID=1076126 RepID=A0A6V8KFT8_9ACTN|nr:Rieske 2Fe-2S domain-containing protein [Phytohabitans houttuyneae]GFJ82250.1 hypothetical protein Phou_064300 [Phytohabitans houttuyneae]
MRSRCWFGLGLSPFRPGRPGAAAFARHRGGNPAPQGWQDLCAQDALTGGRPLAARIGEVPVLVTRTDAGMTAMIAHCGHQTGPLADGELTTVDGADCMVCPWHGSTFRLTDGAVVHGPAATGQPLLRTRVVAGRVQATPP